MSDLQDAVTSGLIDVHVNGRMVRFALRDLLSIAVIKPYEGASYTVRRSDVGAMIETTSGSAVSIVVPPEAQHGCAPGARISVAQGGAGAVTVVAGAGVTIKTAETLVLAKQEAVAMLEYQGSDVWRLAGYLTAA